MSRAALPACSAALHSKALICLSHSFHCLLPSFFTIIFIPHFFLAPLLILLWNIIVSPNISGFWDTQSCHQGLCGCYREFLTWQGLPGSPFPSISWWFFSPLFSIFPLFHFPYFPFSFLFSISPPIFHFSPNETFLGLFLLLGAAAVSLRTGLVCS